MIQNQFREGDLVTIDRKPGLFRVEMPLAGVTWVRSVRVQGDLQAPGAFDSFEWTIELRRVQPAPLRAVAGRRQ